MRPSDSWLVVLRCLHSLQKYEENFATGEVSSACLVHRLRVLRVLHDLEAIKLIAKMPSGYRNRHWSFTSTFPHSLKELISQYENYKLIQNAPKQRR